MQITKMLTLLGVARKAIQTMGLSDEEYDYIEIHPYRGNEAISLHITWEAYERHLANPKFTAPKGSTELSFSEFKDGHRCLFGSTRLGIGNWIIKIESIKRLKPDEVKPFFDKKTLEALK